GDGLRPVSSGKNTRFSKASFGFSWFKVTKDSIYFQFIDEKGNMLYDYTIKKETKVLAKR
ncbi:MAG: hypothetical protein H7263_01665, partial [Candidatus Sericytochromatia bacterium]|nr:hypothetical protein [Candidatus Sericytochromatia bacterium]